MSLTQDRSLRREDSDSDHDDLDLNALEAESLPLHSLSTSTTPASTPKTPQTRPTAYLDGLRGLAAFFVYYYHHLSWFYGPTAPFVWGLGHVDEKTGSGGWYLVQLPFFRIFFSGGNAAVAIFFVLSGYVLSISPLRKLHDGKRKDCLKGLASATVRRPFRLYIPVIAISLIFVAVMHLPFGLAPHVGFPEPLPTVWLELQSWLQQTARVLNPFEPLGIIKPWYIYDPPAYTMAIEYVGSMLVYISLAVLTFVRDARVKVGVFVVLGLGFLSTYQWAMAMFMMGMTLAINDVEGWDTRFLSARLGGRAMSTIHHVSFIGGWYLLSEPSGPMDAGKMSGETPGWYLLTKMIPAIYIGEKKEYWRWWNAWGAMMLVYSVLRIRWLQRFFTTRPLAYLGRLSFMLYLTQAPILWTAADRVYRLFGSLQQDNITTWWDGRLAFEDWGVHGFTVKWILSQAIILPIQFALAELATRWIDVPSIDIGRWIVGRMGIEGKR